MQFNRCTDPVLQERMLFHGYIFGNGLFRKPFSVEEMTEAEALTWIETLQEYNYHTDDGHGWLEVPEIAVAKLGFRPSTCSRQRDDMIFLEHDCDMKMFIEGYKLFYGQEPRIREVPIKGDSIIRKFERCYH